MGTRLHVHIETMEAKFTPIDVDSFIESVNDMDTVNAHPIDAVAKGSSITFEVEADPEKLIVLGMDYMRRIMFKNTKTK